MCSYDRILWQDLRSATEALLNYEGRKILSEPLIYLRDMANASLSVRLKLCTYLTRRSICADPRDRIFALKGLLGPNESDAIKPDYEKSTSEVYRDVVAEHALNLGRLHLLRLCDFSTKLEESPSWVPDWSSPKEQLRVSSFHASSRSTCEANVGMEFLEVSAVYCATVTQVDFLFDADASNMEIVSRISEMVSLHNMDASYIGGGDMLSAYCCTLLENLFSEIFLPPRSDQFSFEDSKSILQDNITRDRDHECQLTSDIASYLDSVRLRMAGRTILTTREGYIGTSLVKPRLGDQVVVLLGCDSPLLSRAAQDSYQVVGQCYVQGFMCAEALLGPMSEG